MKYIFNLFLLLSTMVCGAFPTVPSTRWGDYGVVSIIPSNALICLVFPTNAGFGGSNGTIRAQDFIAGLPFASLPLNADNDNETEFWISSHGSGGDGSQFNPFRCPDSATLGSVLTAETRTNISWNFKAGNFVVPWPGIQPLAGWKIKGAGMDVTTLEMETNAHLYINTAVINTPSPNQKDGVEVSGMTINCNFQNQNNPSNMAAVNLLGSYTLIENVKAVNWGSAAGEAFVLSIGNNQATTNLFPRIKGCIVTRPANVIMAGGVTAISIHGDGFYTNGLARGSLIEDCYVQGVTSGTGLAGSPGYFHGISDGTGGVARNNFLYDLTGDSSVGFYNDHWDGHDSIIDGNIMRNVHIGIDFNMPSYHRTGVVIKNNVISPDQNGIGIYYNRDAGSDTNAFAQWLVSMGNIIYPAEGATTITPVSFDTRNVVTLVGNVLQGSGGQPNFSITGPSNMVSNVTFTNAIP